ncbi:hypothetical protein Rumeso_01450 [Rubellimicrobium mesophilum DSM 19309]|uniref:DUF2793 domain-containing protein n=1 Tax=Rubellimicrobium mesophilum DSM 19309 TaxID=442562 RepID=A0A017HRY9_9RHOB|nr:DUF2793 domain-containing protein [Rubellimicrobium mesophilum]EYD76928.1 hypothetical protein Rumeso_01450 [Rubellimicrobium mesophilum DSM 19309]
MPSTSPRLALPYLQPAQAQKHVTHNEALQLLDAVVQLRIQDFDLTLPPSDVLPGDVIAIGAGAQGDWAGQDGRLALWDGTGWQFIAPAEGWLAWDAATRALRVLSGGVWLPCVPALQNLPGLGVGTASDEVNRLAVASEATLLTHAGAGHQLKVNKAAASDTASLLFQSGWTGHAEMGLAGGLDFALRVSDGTAWTEALRVSRASGVVTLPQGAVLDGPLAGAAVQASPTDATPGRLLTAGAYGLGGPLPAVGDATASLVPGLYAYDTAAGSSGGPAGVLRGALLHARRGASLGETQLLVVEAGSAPNVTPGQTHGRARTGGAWSAWTCGSVAQSDSGASGRVLRGQDGTQTCWHTLTTSATGETVWTFPQPFASAAGLVVTMGVGGATPAPLFPRHTAKGATSVALSVLDSAGARVSATLDVIAMGRWT